MGDLISTFLFQPPTEPTPLDQSKYFFIETTQKHKIPVVHIKNRRRTAYTIIYSHANAEDLGMIYNYLVGLSKLLRVNIIAYDYTGYGINDIGKNPSEESCYFDIEAVYRHLREVESVPAERIILYGRSVGSGPSCYLAQKIGNEAGANEKLGGLILHSPFLSVFRVAIDLGCTINGDMFPNIDRIKDIRCPVLIIHGTHDKIVPFHHGYQLFLSLENKINSMSFWAEKLGHNNIEMEVTADFIRKLQAFIRKVAKYCRRRKFEKDPEKNSSMKTGMMGVGSKDTNVSAVRRCKQMLRHEDSLDSIETVQLKRPLKFTGEPTDTFHSEYFTTVEYVESRHCPDSILEGYEGQRSEVPKRVEPEDGVGA